MKAFTFQGKEGNQSRFGWVKPGQVLVLTDQEAENVKGDKRFRPVKGDKPVEPQNPVLDKANAMEATQEAKIAGLTDDALKAKAVELGVPMRKPVDIQKLRVRVKKALDAQPVE